VAHNGDGAGEELAQFIVRNQLMALDICRSGRCSMLNHNFHRQICRSPRFDPTNQTVEGVVISAHRHNNKFGHQYIGHQYIGHQCIGH
jgi:hypothetical protein